MTTSQSPRTGVPKLALLPTPVVEAPRLSAELGIRLLIKRDDQTGLALGGNKARKLDYLMADAMERGCDTLVTAGGAQSNFARMTAAAAAIAGMGCQLVLSGDDGSARRPSGAGGRGARRRSYRRSLRCDHRRMPRRRASRRADRRGRAGSGVHGQGDGGADRGGTGASDRGNGGVPAHGRCG